MWRGLHIDFCAFHIREFFSNLPRKSGEFLLPGGWRYFPGNSSVILERTAQPQRHIVPVPLHIPGTASIGNARIIARITNSRPAGLMSLDNLNVVLDADAVSGHLTVRMIARDDLFRPLGSGRLGNGLTWLKKRQISRHAREKMLVVVDATNSLVWIPSVQISHTCRVVQTTRSFLFLQYETIDLIG
ncbi:MAG: hypothetical protein GF398_09090 [Chitinivibrionales bacterium]|nr:hypothetical protein [Chitinivibrionales bacterium]